MYEDIPQLRCTGVYMYIIRSFFSAASVVARLLLLLLLLHVYNHSLELYVLRRMSVSAVMGVGLIEQLRGAVAVG